MGDREIALKSESYQLEHPSLAGASPIRSVEVQVHDGAGTWE